MAASQYSNTAKAKDLLFDMFLAYCRGDDFGNLSEDERMATVDYVNEMKNSMIEIKPDQQG